jgi:hypothetical protein
LSGTSIAFVPHQYLPMYYRGCSKLKRKVAAS